MGLMKDALVAGEMGDTVPTSTGAADGSTQVVCASNGVAEDTPGKCISCATAELCKAITEGLLK